MTSYFASPSMRILRDRLSALYGNQEACRCLDRLAMMVGRYGVGGVAPTGASPSGRGKWDERDAVLITYGDMVKAPDRPPLQVLGGFLDRHFKMVFSTIHILPFFPYSSDDGFSVIHFRQVDPELGAWDDIQAIGKQFNLMVDLVLNHASSQSNWFADYLTGIAPARDYFITPPPEADLSAVVRPRTHPLLTEVNTRNGLRKVWTTFSPDQVDLDFANPDVLFEMLDLLLFYISNGARVIRLDAIAYLWKNYGTSCIHQPQTYEVVRIFREFLRLVVPDALLLTETNVPHEENISYFGNGDAAHIVYQFPLPPLILDAIVQGNAKWLTQWARHLQPPPEGCTFLNFTASHDGIGVTPLKGLVPDDHLTALINHIHTRGGGVSWKRNSDGSESPYELNCTWFDAMGRTGDLGHQHEARFLCSQTIPLALQGIPAIYFHSMTATPNDQDEVKRTRRARSVNRGRWQEADLEARLADESLSTARIFREMKRRIAIRGQHQAFHPNSAQIVVPFDDRLFCVERIPPSGHAVLAVANVSESRVTIPAGSLQWTMMGAEHLNDLLDPGRSWQAGHPLVMEPYQCSWFASPQP